MSTTIEAKEICLSELFSEKYLFEIPEFQRQFSWENDNFSQLLDDIKETIIQNRNNTGGIYFDNYEPYFLGSIILLSEEEKDNFSKYAIIDGQQRMISLTILIAVLRDHTVNEDHKMDLQNLIYQKASIAKGTPESVRIKAREKEKDFFKEYILTLGGTLNALELGKDNLSEPKQRMLDAISTFYSGFLDEHNYPDQELIDLLIRYLLQKVVLVYVKTDSLSSGFRLFNIINARGLSLNNADLLKSENLREIQDEQERHRYTTIWENIEEEIGSDEVEMLISFMRSIKVQERAEKAIFEEFNEKVFKNDPSFRGELFIEYFDKIKGIYCDYIKDATLKSGDPDKDTYYFNLISVMRDYLPFNDWMCALIRFQDKYNNDHRLYEFVKKLEKKLVVDWVMGLSLPERLNRIFKIIKLIDVSKTPHEVIDNDLLNDEVKANRSQFERALDDNYFYSRARYQIPKYMLLRIDLERKYNQNLQFKYTGYIQVEHILPRTPVDHYWTSRFDELKRIEWTNKLGNLALLNNRKNPQASNKPFPDKVNDYFEKVSDFELTKDLKKYSDWNLQSLQSRHRELIDDALSIWVM